MMKVTNSAEKITPFRGFNFVFRSFKESGLSDLIDKQLGPRVKTFGFSYSDIFANHLAIYLNGGDCTEDVNDTESTNGEIVAFYNARGFWWTETERQVRVQGNATEIVGQLADQYFSARNRDSQIVSIVSEQGYEIENIETLIKKYENVEAEFPNKVLKRPENWGGYFIEPIRIEFLEFNLTRFHDRKLCELINGQWTTKQLQP